jgi:hypothetical protein
MRGGSADRNLIALEMRFSNSRVIWSLSQGIDGSAAQVIVALVSAINGARSAVARATIRSSDVWENGFVCVRTREN